MEITERQKQILCQIIEEYAETASPVGSVTMAKLFGVSPATVRAEMAKLEMLGLISQPHTSAGRVPTDAGYRFYVNNLEDNREMKDDVESSVEASSDMSLERGIHALVRRVSSQSQADAANHRQMRQFVEQLILWWI